MGVCCQKGVSGPSRTTTAACSLFSPSVHWFIVLTPPSCSPRYRCAVFRSLLTFRTDSMENWDEDFEFS